MLPEFQSLRFPRVNSRKKPKLSAAARLVYYFIGQQWAVVMKRISITIVLSIIVCAGFPQNTIDPSSINIVRDKWGVPHIFAQTDAEVAYGLAWAHSEDDFETIQKCYLASKSMLGQHAGRDGAVIDYVVHFLGIRELVDSLYEKDISDSYKLVLEGYCDGLNAYARTHPKELFVKRAFPVSPKDILTYTVLQLALGCGVEDAMKKIFHGSIPLAEWKPDGSNAFALNSKKTADGNVYVAINTHHPLEGQVSWYEAHLSSQQGWNIVGALFPGSPVIFTGINENLAWTHTVNHPDKLDVYQLEMHPANPLQYRVDNEWYTLQETTVKLKIKVPGFNLHMKRKAYRSIYGPTMVTDRGVFAIRTAGLMRINALEQWYKMNKARNFTEFNNALKMEAIPGYNFVYGDRFDTIYYLSNGRLPVRAPGYDWKGTLPGNTNKTLWSKIHPLQDLPQILNPPSGYVFNTNNSPFNATAPEDNLDRAHYDTAMGYETHDNNRSVRVMELMKQFDRVSYEDFKRIKYDVQLPHKLHYPVNIDTLFLLDENRYPQLADVIGLLKGWDRKGTVDSKGATVFGVFFYYIAPRYENDNSFTAMTEEMCVEALTFVKDYLIRNFGSTSVTLGQYQRLERGEKSMPLAGLPDVLAAMYCKPTENGRMRGAIGDCYIGFVKFTPSGPEIETINCYGASNRKGSQHYSDQMRLYQQQKTKKMSLDEEEVYRGAKTVYHPEILSKLPLTARLTRGRR
jgi:acyl-homoserine-lactone acylase